MKKDFRWWIKCIGSHNGVKWFPSEINKNNSEIIFTDASDTGAAAVLGGKWCMQIFEGKLKWIAKKSINWREAYAVLLGVSTFGPELKNKSLLMNIDNQAMQQAIQQGKSKDSEIMALIRCIYFYTAIYNIDYKTVFIPGNTNVLADRLSRGKVGEFRVLAPKSELKMTTPCDMILNF